ncbi:hypothetical protein BGZ61DRAFT_454645 [Ilyonectria robusta]|uniref:uncharacterized protein n=1 Tax=Ilyonectria robusta TaxID=1079257 RepID=UPI001E8D8332|nr:uncharacterized protein BGZ61DRAFT_454645 [Ilyonectria robusta]KAH8686561.1 hypothetical protein BGZ61DRAFT_454645 [Ilyonectria robusta]
MVPGCVAVDVAWDIGDEDDDDGANGRDKRQSVCVCVCVCVGVGVGVRLLRTYTIPIHMGVGLKTTRGHRRTWETARIHPRATTTHQHQPGPWESLDMPWAIGWGLGAFPGIPWDVFFFPLWPSTLFPGSPPPSLLEAPSFRETGVWEGVPLPGRRQGRGVTSLSLFFPLGPLVRLFLLFLFAFRARSNRRCVGGERGEPGRFLGGAILCHIEYSQSSSTSSHMALAETQRMQF